LPGGKIHRGNAGIDDGIIWADWLSDGANLHAPLHVLYTLQENAVSGSRHYLHVEIDEHTLHNRIYRDPIPNY